MDIAWTYPGQRGGKQYDKENLVLLIKVNIQKFIQFKIFKKYEFQASTKFYIKQ